LPGKRADRRRKPVTSASAAAVDPALRSTLQRAGGSTSP
jgi:hypothetical protein